MMPKIKESNFYEVINKAISERNHAEYLQQVIKQYDNYKQEFKESFTDKNPTGDAYKFRVSYLLKKSLWRDIEILGTQTFFDLAETIIESMGWDNDHMHGFELPEKSKTQNSFFSGSALAFFAPGWEDDPHPTYKTDEIRICDIDYTKRPRLEFTFDYGDGHLFKIEHKGSRPAGKKERHNFPLVVNQRGVAPQQYPDYENR